MKSYWIDIRDNVSSDALSSNVASRFITFTADCRDSRYVSHSHRSIEKFRLLFDAARVVDVYLYQPHAQTIQTFDSIFAETKFD